MEIVKKLSMKVLVGNVKSVSKDLQEGQSMDLARVVGIARGIKTGLSSFGDWTALTGDFVAEPVVGTKMGKRFRTGQLFLPDVALNLVTPVVDGLAKGEGVEVAFMIGITEDETSGPGYVYNAKFLVEPKGNDPMEALLNRALPSPNKPNTTATETAEEKGETQDTEKVAATGRGRR